MKVYIVLTDPGRTIAFVFRTEPAARAWILQAKSTQARNLWKLDWEIKEYEVKG